MFGKRPTHLFLALVPMTIAEQGVRNLVLQALHTRAGTAAGLGVAEVSAALRALSSVPSLAMPIAYGWLYAWHPCSPWAVAALFAILSQAVFSALREDDLANIM